MYVALFPCGALPASDIARRLKHIKQVDEIIGLSSASDKETERSYEGFFTQVIYDLPTMDKSFELDNFIRMLPPLLTHLIPCNDDAVRFLSPINGKHSNIRVMAPSSDIIHWCFDKELTYLKFPTISPKIMNLCQLFQKPKIGHSSIGATNFVAPDNSVIVTERLEGSEYTVQCFGQHILGVRKRNNTCGGMSIHTTRENTQVVVPTDIQTLLLPEFAKNYIPWFFQIKGKKLLEVQPRLAGASGCGPNMFGYDELEAWLDNSKLPYQTSVLNVSAARKVHSYYYDVDLPTNTTLYVDFDDTLTIDMWTALLHYRQQTPETPIHLITRHKGNILVALQKRFIPPAFFTSIIILSKHTQKKIPINQDKYNLLIDDSFRERKEWDGAAITPYQAIGILNNFKSSIRPTQKQRHEARETPYEIQHINTLTGYVQDSPDARQVLEHNVLRQHITIRITGFLNNIVGQHLRHRVLNIGPREELLEEFAERLELVTLDIVPGCDLQGDVTKFIPRPPYSAIILSEVLEHTITPWTVPQVLYDALSPGGNLFVSTPFSFRMHHPAPDGYRFSPTGLINLFGPLFGAPLQLTTIGDRLQPLGTCANFQKPQQVLK